jgi:hypothetical protein
MLDSVADVDADREFVMRPGWRRVLLWLPVLWLTSAAVATVHSLLTPSSRGFVYWSPFFLLYGVAFVWLSRFQIVRIRVRGDVLEFVSRARVVPLFLGDLVEIAPARGVLQHRLATRFRSHRKRVTVLGRTFRDFDQLVALADQRSNARVVRY